MEQATLSTGEDQVEPVLGFVPSNWEVRSHCPDLRVNEVHVWSADLNLEDWEIKSLRVTLSEREQARVDRFKFDKHRRRYIASRGRLRELLGNYSGIESHHLMFQYGERGKPSLPDKVDGKELKFNSTDSDEKALFAFAWEHELGIDLECFPREVEHDDLAERYFAPAEASALQRFPDGKRREAFLACWTRKEAFGKIEGVGIRYPLESVCLCDNLGLPKTQVQPLDRDKADFWTIFQFKPDYPAVAALALSSNDLVVRYFDFE